MRQTLSQSRSVRERGGWVNGCSHVEAWLPVLAHSRARPLPHGPHRFQTPHSPERNGAACTGPFAGEPAPTRPAQDLKLVRPPVGAASAAKGPAQDKEISAFFGRRRAQFERAAAAPLVTVFPRRCAKEVAVGTGKMRPRREAAGQPDLDDRLAGLHQHLSRLVQPQLQVILARHAVQVPVSYTHLTLPTKA